MKKYIIQLPNSDPTCFVANWDGDPGRTLLRSRAKTFRSKESAEKAKETLEAKSPNRKYKVVEL